MIQTGHRRQKKKRGGSAAFVTPDLDPSPSDPQWSHECVQQRAWPHHDRHYLYRWARIGGADEVPVSNEHSNQSNVPKKEHKQPPNWPWSKRVTPSDFYEDLGDGCPRGTSTARSQLMTNPVTLCDSFGPWRIGRLLVLLVVHVGLVGVFIGYVEWLVVVGWTVHTLWCLHCEQPANHNHNQPLNVSNEHSNQSNVHNKEHKQPPNRPWFKRVTSSDFYEG